MTINGDDLSIGFSRALGKVVVHISGALDSGTAGVLRARLVDVIDGQGNRHLVLDLAGISHIDAAGLAVLVDALKRMQKNGGELVLHHPPSDVAQAIQAAGLDKVFVITPAWAHPSHGEGRSVLGTPAGWR